MIATYRRQRLAEERKDDKRARFGRVYPIGREDYTREVTEASNVDEEDDDDETGTGVVCFLYKDGCVCFLAPVGPDTDGTMRIGFREVIALSSTSGRWHRAIRAQNLSPSSATSVSLTCQIAECLCLLFIKKATSGIRLLPGVLTANDAWKVSALGNYRYYCCSHAPLHRAGGNLTGHRRSSYPRTTQARRPTEGRRGR